MKSCITKKKSYPTREIAEDALIEARIQYEYPEGGGPVNVYQCEDCGDFHLTSKGPVNGKLAAHLSEGKIKRQKEAGHWMDKLKKRKF